MPRNDVSLGQSGPKPLPQHTPQAHAPTPHVHWEDVLKADPEPARPLTTAELQRLHRLGFTNLALALAAGTCPTCRLNRAGRTHRELCETPQPHKAPAAPTPIRQPWEARPARRAA